MKSLTERHVQAIWYDAALRPKRLRTRRGSEVSVITPGEWNLGPGPDFRNAVLELGPARRRLVGDVEIHLCPSDWDLHRHGSDPNYRNVVAHVTWRGGPDPDSLPSGAVSIWLGPFVTSDPSFAPGQIDLSAYPYARIPSEPRPCEALVGHDPDLGRMLMADAGRRRLRLKAQRLVGRLCARAGAGPEARRQVFYEEVMTALGYSRNQMQFRHVAERIPLAALPEETDAAKAALLVAGEFEEWCRDEGRPCNAHELRLKHAAEIFTKTPTMSLAESIDFSRPACLAMVTAMCGCRFIGRGRAAAIVANVIVPFALAEDRTSECPDWLPPEDVSSPVRLTAFRLFGRDHNPSALYAGNGLLIQGLLQIHHECCARHHPDCGTCGIVSRSSAMPSSASGRITNSRSAALG